MDRAFPPPWEMHSRRGYEPWVDVQHANFGPHPRQHQYRCHEQWKHPQWERGGRFDNGRHFPERFPRNGNFRQHFENGGNFRQHFENDGNFCQHFENDGNFCQHFENGGNFRQHFENGGNFRQHFENGGNFRQHFENGGNFRQHFENGGNFRQHFDNGGNFCQRFENGGNYNNDNFPYRGSFRMHCREKFQKNRPYQSSFNKGSEKSFPKGSDNYHRSSRSSTLIDVTPHKKENDSEKAEAQSTVPKVTNEAQEDSAASVKQSDPPQVSLETSQTIISPRDFSFRLPCDSCPQTREEASPKKRKVELVQVKDSEAVEDHLSQTASFPSAEAPTEEATVSKTIDFHPMEKEEPVRVQPKGQQVTGDHPNQTAPLPSTETPTEEQAPPETIENVHPMENEEPLLFQLKDGQAIEEPSSQIASFPSVEAPADEQALCEATEDFHPTEKEEPLLTLQVHNHEDENIHQACVALAIGSSSVPTTQSDVHFVPVLVSEKKTDLTDFWEAPSLLHAEQLRGWAPEDYQEPPHCVDSTDECDTASEHYGNLLSCHSPPRIRLSCDQKSDTGRSIQTVLEHSPCSPKSHYSSDSRHSSTNQTPRTLRVWSPRSPPRRDWSPQSPPRQDRYHSRRSSGGREDDVQAGPYSHCHCKYCKNATGERLQEREFLPLYSAHKTHHHHSSKERRKCYRMMRSYFSKRPVAKIKKRKSTCPVEGEKKKKKQLRSEETEKKKRTTSGKSIEPPKIQMPALSEDPSVSCLSCAGEGIGISAQSQTSCDRSAAVLAKMEQIEQAYQHAVLNLAAVTIMLLEKQPCMEEAIEAALRANLRSIGDFYECKLKNFIDSFDLAEAS